MLIELALVLLTLSLLSSVQLERREARLRAGLPVWSDLARITGVADQRKIASLPGVSLDRDGRLRFDPARRAALPVHMTGSLFDHRLGHGLSLSFAIATLGIGAGVADVPWAARMLLFGAAVYQLLSRLYALAVWVEARALP